MADILDLAEIEDIRSQVAPETGDDQVSIIEVWRMSGPGPMPPVGGGGVDRFRMEVEEGTDPDRPDQRRAKVAEYPARITRAGVGKEGEAGSQAVSINGYTLAFNWGDDPDIAGGDRLLEKRAEWAPHTGFSEGDIIQPTASNGRFYICETAGVTGSVEPTFIYPVYNVTTSVPDLNDGSVVWKYGDYLRTFEVVDPGGDTTFKIIRLVRAEEVKS